MTAQLKGGLACLTQVKSPPILHDSCLLQDDDLENVFSMKYVSMFNILCNCYLSNGYASNF